MSGKHGTRQPNLSRTKQSLMIQTDAPVMLRRCSGYGNTSVRILRVLRTGTHPRAHVPHLRSSASGPWALTAREHCWPCWASVTALSGLLSGMPPWSLSSLRTRLLPVPRPRRAQAETLCLARFPRKASISPLVSKRHSSESYPFRDRAS